MSNTACRVWGHLDEDEGVVDEGDEVSHQRRVRRERGVLVSAQTIRCRLGLTVWIRGGWGLGVGFEV